MKELNIGKVLINKRKDRGITQDELANYIGISKASVSKWETGQSYPDITLLPLLATYFNISVDELLGYEPQMIKKDIRKLYHKLSEDFTKEPFQKVIDQCRDVIKRYYSCFPLLFQMGTLLLNHSGLSGDEEQRITLVKDAKDLFIKIKLESGEVELSKSALYMEASCCIHLGEPVQAIDLLEDTNTPFQSTDLLLATAYQMAGDLEKAKSTIQFDIYQNVIAIVGSMPNYLMMCIEDTDRCEEIIHRSLQLVELFKIECLHPVLAANIYLSSAMGYVMQNNKSMAISKLQSYTQLIGKMSFPLKLRGDEFFNTIDFQLNDLDLGVDSPRDNESIIQSLIAAVVHNPAFEVLVGEPRYKCILENIKNLQRL